ncbi:MAG: aminoacyl-tRNA hydrolase [Patescibacteria group bacterium]|jgi:PTH1 family peptidyl-tRNA hydrolase
MKLIVGLGNPGKKYAQTWHNLGFLVIDQIQNSKPDEFLKFKNSDKFKAEICEGNGAGEKIILAKPQTFMNQSGETVRAMANFYKIKPDDLWVINDDIDLPLGKLRISHNASAAGHKGVQSIIDEIGSQKFVRFRLGINQIPPVTLPTEKYVLQKIDEKSMVLINETIKEILAAIEIGLASGIPEAMNEFN